MVRIRQRPRHRLVQPSREGAGLQPRAVLNATCVRLRRLLLERDPKVVNILDKIDEAAGLHQKGALVGFVRVNGAETAHRCICGGRCGRALGVRLQCDGPKDYAVVAVQHVLVRSCGAVMLMMLVGRRRRRSGRRGSRCRRGSRASTPLRFRLLLLGISFSLPLRGLRAPLRRARVHSAGVANVKNDRRHFVARAHV